MPSRMNTLGSYPVSFVIFWILITHYSLLFLPGCATQAKLQRLKEASAHYKLGVSYLNDQHDQQAFVEFQKAVELNPDDWDSHYYLGHIYTKQGKYDEAIREFKNALKSKPGYSDAHNYLGSIYALQGKSEKAVREYQMALKDPTYANPQFTHYNLGRIYESMGKYNEAIEEFKMAVKISPNYVPAYNAMAQVYTNQGKFEEASAAYLDVLKQFPDDVTTKYKLAWVYLQANAVSKAITEFSEIVKRFPESPEAKRSQKHLGFLQSKIEKLRPGMTIEQVIKVLGKHESVARETGPNKGAEQWILNNYDLVLRFEDGRYMGYQESPRK